MDKVIIFGTSDFSAVLYQTIIQESQAEVVAFTLDKACMKEDCFEGLPVIPFEELSSRYDMGDIKIAVTLGYKKMNDVRKAVFEQCKKAGYNIYTFISEKASVYTNRIGEGSIILPTAFIGPYVSIGKSVILWNMAAICHHSVVGDYAFIAGGTTVGGGTNIGANCFIGMNCTLKNGICVGDRTFLGASSYLSQDTETGLGYVGNPATNNRGIKSDLMVKFL